MDYKTGREIRDNREKLNVSRVRCLMHFVSCFILCTRYLFWWQRQDDVAFAWEVSKAISLRARRPGWATVAGQLLGVTLATGQAGGGREEDRDRLTVQVQIHTS